MSIVLEEMSFFFTFKTKHCIGIVLVKRLETIQA